LIARSTVLSIGISQLISWGTTFYLIGVFGEPMAAELGWTRPQVHGGLSLALLVMALWSPLAGRLVDRHGGRPVMAAGAVVAAVGCLGLALGTGLPLYYAAWCVIGSAMRFILYDAAFAALARLGGPGAAPAMAQITLFGGLASTAFWPIGHLLIGQLGWRGALVAYAGFLLATVPLSLAIPASVREPKPVRSGAATVVPPIPGPGGRLLAGALYAVIVAMTGALTAGLAAHVISVLSGLGVDPWVAVWIATWIGIGQLAGRLWQVLFGQRISPLMLTLVASAFLPFCLAGGLMSGHSVVAAIAFALSYGAANGVLWIMRGTLPLVLFDHRTYGSLVGRLLVPGFLFTAAAPFAYALVIERFGPSAAFHLSISMALVGLGAAAILVAKFRDKVSE
jgi:MFS family permease